MQKIYLKHKDNLLTIFLFIFISWFLGKVFDYYMPITNLLNELPNIISKVVSYKITIQLVPSIISLIIIYGLYLLFLKFKIRKSNLKILDANYGADQRFINITNELNNAVSENKLKIIINNNIAGDPAYLVPKVAIVKYQFQGNEYRVECEEGKLLELPVQRA